MDAVLDTTGPARGLPRTADAVVVGGGLAGLTAAVLVAREGRRVVLLDATRLGGRARTDQAGRFRFNRGPHALYDGGHAARVLRRLGVRWTGRAPLTAGTHVRLGDDVVPLPSTPAAVVASRLYTLREKAQMARVLRDLSRPAPADRSAEEWLAEQGLTGRALDNLRLLTRVSSYAGDLTGLSADAAASQVALALRGVTYLDGGWQRLVDALAGLAEAAGTVLAPGCTTAAVDATPGGWSVRTAAGDVRAPAVVLACGGPAEVARLSGHDPGDLGAPVTAAALDLGLGVAPAVPLLFSFDDPLYLSLHSPPATLTDGGPGAVVHVLRYGARDAAVDRADLERHAAAAGIDVDAAENRRLLARMVVAHTAPSPARGGLAGRPQVEVPERRGLFVAGDWVGPRGLLADASVASAEDAAHAATAYLDLVAGGRRSPARAARARP